MTVAQQLSPFFAQSMEDAVREIEQPCRQAQQKHCDRRQTEMHGSRKEPCPEDGDGGCVQAEQVPPCSESVAAAQLEPAIDF